MKKIKQKYIVNFVIMLLAVFALSSVLFPSEAHEYDSADDFYNAELEDSDDTVLDALIRPIVNFVMWISDLVLKLLQYMMVGVGQIENYNGVSQIQYSPGIIFMDRVAGLKIDFISANPGEVTKIYNNLQALETDEDLKNISEKIADTSPEKIFEGTYYWVDRYLDEDDLLRDGQEEVIVSAYLPEEQSYKNITLSPVWDGKKVWGKWVGYDWNEPEEGKDSIPELTFIWGYTPEHPYYTFAPLILGKTQERLTYSRIWHVGQSNNFDTEDPYSGLSKAFDCKFDTYNLETELKGKGGPMASLSTELKESVEYNEQLEKNFLKYDEKLMDERFIITKKCYIINKIWTTADGYLYCSKVISTIEDENEKLEKDENGNIIPYGMYVSVERWNLEDLDLIDLVAEKYSIAGKLKNTIATWYKALRTIALVSLLSIIVYIGIKIVLSSSSAQNKAKYKNMLKDWLVALALLFVLHYMMAFMVEISSNLIKIVSNNVAKTSLDGNIYDGLMSSVRDKAYGITSDGGYDFETTMGGKNGFGIMYMALVILTLTFTFKYLKRVIYMAFFTMVAPVIAITYPLDKVKDGKAQAFNYWLREYIYNCLIQPVHLLLYTVLISSCFEFAKQNVIYSVVALAFFALVEKIVREMFGLKESTSSEGKGSGFAAGAMVTGLINNMRAKPPKEDGGKSGGNDVKTANPESSGENPGGGGSGGGSGGSSGGSSGSGGSSPQPNRLNGIKAVAKKKIGNLDTWKTRRKKFTRSLAGTALGAAAGVATLAANIADGDLFSNPTKAFTEVAGGALAGYHAGNNLMGRGMQGISSTIETYKEGAYGKEGYANRKANKEFYESDECKNLRAQLERGGMSQADIDSGIEEFLDNNIRDAKIIAQCLDRTDKITGAEYSEIAKVGIKNPEDFARVKANNLSKGLSSKALALRMKIVRELPAKLDISDDFAFRRHLANYGITDETEALELRNTLNDFI